MWPPPANPMGAWIFMVLAGPAALLVVLLLIATGVLHR